MAKICLIYLGKKYKTLNVLNELGLSWKSAENNVLPEIRSIEPVLRSIEPGRKSLILLQPLDSNFTLTHTLWASLKQDKHLFWSWFSNITIRVLNTLVPKSLEPNKLYCDFHIVVAAFETPKFPCNAHALSNFGFQYLI